MESPVYNYDVDINALNYGENVINITLLSDSSQIIFVTSIIITLLSNFILPEKTIYFLNDTPDIYYKPKGVSQSNQSVLINNIQYYTNSEGLINELKNIKTTGEHNLILKANSQGLTEEKSFLYELKQPFKIEQKSYHKTQGITYRITIYDNEHINWNTTTPQSIISVKNNGNNINYNYSFIQSSTELIYDITIAANDAIGTNILTVTIGEYSESKIFKLYSHLFELQTTTTNLGQQTLKIQSLSDDTESITITGTGISQQSTTKTNDIFNVLCIISQAGNITLNISDGEITETATLTINKSNIDSSISMDLKKFTLGYNNNVQAIWHINNVPVEDTITVIINNAGTQTTKTQLINNEKNETISFSITNLNIGTNTLSITFVGNTNYNSFTKSINYEILNVLNNIYLDNNQNLILNFNTPNTNVTTNINLNGNNDLVIEKNTYDYIDNSIENVSLNNDKDLIITKR